MLAEQYKATSVNNDMFIHNFAKLVERVSWP